MNGEETADVSTTSPDRTATVRTQHDDPELVRAALAPDNTDSMDARVDDETVVCTINRETTGGLQSTVDDYLVNLQVADRLVDRSANYRHAVAAQQGQQGQQDRQDQQDRHNRQDQQDPNPDQSNKHTTDTDTTDTDTTHQT